MAPTMNSFGRSTHPIATHFALGLIGFRGPIGGNSRRRTRR